MAMEISPILRFVEVPFQNLSIFLQMFSLIDVKQHFCDITTMT